MHILKNSKLFQNHHFTPFCFNLHTSLSVRNQKSHRLIKFVINISIKTYSGSKYSLKNILDFFNYIFVSWKINVNDSFASFVFWIGFNLIYFDFVYYMRQYIYKKIYKWKICHKAKSVVYGVKKFWLWLWWIWWCSIIKKIFNRSANTI